VVDENLYQWIEETLFQVVKETGGILEEATIWDQRVRASWAGISFIKAFAFRSNRSIHVGGVVAHASTSAVEWAKQFRACHTQPGTSQSCRERSSNDIDRNLLEIVLTRQPLALNINFQHHFVLDARSTVTSAFASGRFKAFTIRAIIFLVEVDTVRVVWIRAVELRSFESLIGRSINRTVIGLSMEAAKKANLERF
jgi:hypothetical protein